ncbi:beta strand repeat-containing protein [Dyella silvatica]|uniref:beta strand repeat-containing protein n=1 Tax=Dyella silvatica TaxID=2992128 RepID=UPI00225B1A08|nr:MBG domain-containing protein [Dyella silvatica]
MKAHYSPSSSLAWRSLRRPLTLAIALALAPASWAQNLPGGFTLKSGQVDLPSTVGKTMTVTQHSKGGIVEWNNFDIANTYHVDFKQPSADSVTLNRVVGSGGASNIDGLLTANGRVFVINTAGVLFNSNAQVNVGGLVASVLDISNADFNSGLASGKYVFSGSENRVDNLGKITTAANGTVALLGNINNNGTITAPGGTIVMGGGKQVTYDIGGDGLTQLVINIPDNFGNTVTNNGQLYADGGSIALISESANPGNGLGVVNQSGIAQAHSLQNRSGQIVLSGGSNGSVVVQGMVDVSGTSTVSGGTITINGYDVSTDASANIVTDGLNAGPISMHATNVLGMASSTMLSANALGNGNGGTIAVVGDQTLYAFGSASARGGASGGNGGSIETFTSNGMDTSGFHADAGAANGMPGQWLINAAANLQVVNGNVTGQIPDFPYLVINGATVQDSDVNRALNNGTHVSIGTAATSAGGSTNIVFNSGVQIQRDNGTAPLALHFDSNTSISSNGNFSMISNAGPLNMYFNSISSTYNSGNAINFSNMTTLKSNGGDILMYGQSDPNQGYARGIALGGNGVTIDTRTGGSDTAPAGQLLLRGWGLSSNSLSRTGVLLEGGFGPGLTINTGTGDISIVGRGDGGGSGILMDLANVPSIQLLTSSGNIRMSGFGSSQPNVGVGDGISSSYPGFGSGSIMLKTGSGTIDLRGYGVGDQFIANNQPSYSNGIDLTSNTSLQSTSGDILLTGSSLGQGRGIMLEGAGNNSAPSSIDAGSGNIVLRAYNLLGDTSNPFLFDGTVHSSGTVNIRGGSVDTSGNVIEDTADPIQIGAGNTYAGGINLLQSDLNQIQAGTLVLGSAVQRGDVSVAAEAGNISYSGNLVLQAGGGGSVRDYSSGVLNVGNHTLALVGSAGVSQVGAISAGALLAISSAGSVQLSNDANQISADTVAGSAAGDFIFHNAGDVGIGTVNASGMGSTSNTPMALTGNGISAGGHVLAQSINGNVLLNAPVAGNTVDLVANSVSGTFQNPAGAAINAPGSWHVWASTWNGENRGGLVGNGAQPNLFGCTYGAACAVSPAANASQFIYRKQPTATITMDSFSRQYGLANPILTYVVNGLLFGDQVNNAINGMPVTSATQASHVGSYIIGGNFVSPTGYLLTIVPGSLMITPATLYYTANDYSRIYGDPNGVLGGSVTGFRNNDTLATATTGNLGFTSSANQGSNVGTYAINGGGLQAGDYVLLQAPGNATALQITPAMLQYVADPSQRTVGKPNGLFGGTLSGFRNGDTSTSATSGTLSFQSPAGPNSPAGSYAIDGSGLTAMNYYFAQAGSNATALTITAPAQTYTLDLVRDTPSSYVYDRNFGIVALCPAVDLTTSSRDQDGDTLTREWARVRSRPNLANCVSTRQKNSCGDF